MTKRGGGVVCGIGFESFRDGQIQGFGGACIGRAEELFEFRPSFFDGI